MSGNCYMTGNPKPCSADHGRIVYSIHCSVHCSENLNTDPGYERRYRIPLPADSFNLDLLFMFQMSELTCSESPVDRLSHVGLILKADSHVAVRLPIRIQRSINGWSYLHKNRLFIVIILVSDHVLLRLCRKTSSL